MIPYNIMLELTVALSYLRTLRLSKRIMDTGFGRHLLSLMGIGVTSSPSDPIHRSHIFAVLSGMMMSRRGVAFTGTGVGAPHDKVALTLSWTNRSFSYCAVRDTALGSTGSTTLLPPSGAKAHQWQPSVPSGPGRDRRAPRHGGIVVGDAPGRSRWRPRRTPT